MQRGMWACASGLIVLVAAEVVAQQVPSGNTSSSAASAASASPSLTPIGKTSLTTQEQQAVNGVSAAWLRGDPWAAMQILSPLVNKINRDKLAEVERILKERAIAPIGEILAQARLAIVQQGQAGELPKPQAAEALLVLPQLASQVNAALKLRDKNPVMTNPLPTPATIQDYEDLLWESHVLKNRLLNARRVAEYSGQIAKTVPRSQVEKLSDEQRKIIQQDFQERVAEIDRSLQELEEREIELRIWRLKLAIERLQEKKLTVDKFMAAYASGVDARQVSEFFAARKKSKIPYLRTDLTTPDLPKLVAADAEEARRLSGDLQPKAEAYFDALHWWYRGRYGMGTHVFGLAKSPAAKTNPDALFGLHMPATPPKPTDPAAPQTSPIPTFDRRHHYWWAWEDRRVARHTEEQWKSTTQVSLNATKYDTTFFW